MKTLTDRVIDYVRRHPGTTVTAVAQALARFARLQGRSTRHHRYVKGSFSGVMVGLCRRGRMTRFPGVGPRGGHGYWVK